MTIRVGDKVRWYDPQVLCEVWEVQGERASIMRAERVRSGNSLWVVPLSELTLVAPQAGFTSAPAKEPSPDFTGGVGDWIAEVDRLKKLNRALRSDEADSHAENERLKVENARLREALQMAVNAMMEVYGASEHKALDMAAALGIRPKETP